MHLTLVLAVSELSWNVVFDRTYLLSYKVNNMPQHSVGFKYHCIRTINLATIHTGQPNWMNMSVKLEFFIPQYGYPGWMCDFLSYKYSNWLVRILHAYFLLRRSRLGIEEGFFWYNAFPSWCWWRTWDWWYHHWQLWGDYSQQSNWWEQCGQQDASEHGLARRIGINSFFCTLNI